MEGREKMKESQRPHYFLRYFLSLIMTVVLFLLIFSVANSVAYYNYQKVSFQNNVIQENIEELDQYIDQLSCSSELLFESSRKLEDSGIKIGFLEESFGKEDSRVLEQKKLYTQLEIKHFEIVKYLNERCDVGFVTILFFYSNDELLSDLSQNMGYIISMFKYENPFRVMVYSFDDSLNYGPIDDLKEAYSINDLPISLINENDLIYIYNIDQLEGYLNSPFLSP